MEHWILIGRVKAENWHPIKGEQTGHNLFTIFYTHTNTERDTHTFTGRQETFQFVFYMAKLENKKRKLSFSIFRRRRRRKCLCKFWNATNWKSFSCSTCRRLPYPLSLFYTRKFSLCVRNIKFKKIAAGKASRRKCCWGRTSSAAAHTHTAHSTIIAGNGSAKCCHPLPLAHSLLHLLRFQLLKLLFELQPHLKLQQSGESHVHSMIYHIHSEYK